MNGLVYIVGWTCRKFLKSHACEICREQLVDSKGDLDSSNIFCHFKAEERPESLFGGLTLPSHLCLQHFKEVESVVRSSIEKAMLSNRISQNLMTRLQNHTFVTPLQLCSTQLVSAIHLIYVRLKVFYSLKWRNRGQFTKVYKKNRKLLKLQNRFFYYRNWNLLMLFFILLFLFFYILLYFYYFFVFFCRLSFQVTTNQRLVIYVHALILYIYWL